MIFPNPFLNGWTLLPNIFIREVDGFAFSEHFRMDRSASMRLRPDSCRLKQLDSVLGSDEKTILCWLQENISDLNTKHGQEEETFLHRSTKVQYMIFLFLTFLYRAVRKNHLYAVETMIAAGAEVDIPNIQGWS